MQLIVKDSFDVQKLCLQLYTVAQKGDWQTLTITLRNILNRFKNFFNNFSCALLWLQYLSRLIQASVLHVAVCNCHLEQC